MELTPRPPACRKGLRVDGKQEINLEWPYYLHLQNQIDVWGSIMTGFPPVAEKVPCQLSHPPPPPCTNLTFTVPPVPGHLTDNQPCSLPLHPHTPPVKVCACVYCHDEVVHQCSMLSGDLHMVPDGQQQFMAG